MSTTYTPNASLQIAARGDRNWDQPINANTASLDALTCVGSLCATPSEQPSASLAIKVSPGVYAAQDGTPTAYAGGTASMPANASQCVWLNAAGVLTQGSAFPSTPHVRICVAMTGPAAITSIADARVVHRMIGV